MRLLHREDISGKFPKAFSNRAIPTGQVATSVLKTSLWGPRVVSWPMGEAQVGEVLGSSVRLSESRRD